MTHATPSVLLLRLATALLVLAGCAPDAPVEFDAGTAPDASTERDASAERDAGAPLDAPGEDSAPPADAGTDAETPAVSVRIATPWNGALVAGSRPTFRTLPEDVAVDVEICRDPACTSVELTLSGTPPLAPTTDLDVGVHYARARASEEGATSPTFSFEVTRTGEGDGMWLGRSDLDRDGFEEVVITQHDFPGAVPRVIVLEGSADGPIGGWARAIGESSFERYSARVAGDVDGDGYVDLVIRDAGLHVYRGSADGLIAAPTVVAVVDATGASASCGSWGPLGDVDRDGYADVALTCRLSTSSFVSDDVVWLRGGPSGLDPVARPFSTVPLGDTAHHVGGFDVDGDGHADAIAGNRSVHLGSSTGPGASAATLPSCSLVIGAGDTDADGAVDLVSRGNMVGASCDLDPFRSLSWSGVALEPGDAADVGRANDWAAGRDVDGDGATDLALVLERIGTVGVGGVLLSGTTLVDLGVISTGPRGVSTSDANGDGYADVAITSGPSDVRWFPGSATGPSADDARTITGPSL